jgi:aquaporin NIP
MAVKKTKSKLTTKSTTRAAAAKPAAKPTAATKSVASRKPTTRYGEVLKRRFKGDLMLGTLFAELFGAFVLTTAVLVTSGNIIIAALTVLILVMALSVLSGAHVNPAISLSMFVTGQLSLVRTIGYVIAQFFGAMLAFVVVTQFVTTGEANPLTGQAVQVFAADKLAGDWRPFFGELLGALVFGFAVASVVMAKKQGIEAAFTIGGGLLIGLVFASQASAAILNPAVAVGVSAYQTDNQWTFWVYALAPIVGAMAGAWLYKLLQWDVLGGRNVSE